MITAARASTTVAARSTDEGVFYEPLSMSALRLGLVTIASALGKPL